MSQSIEVSVRLWRGHCRSGDPVARSVVAKGVKGLLQEFPAAGELLPRHRLVRLVGEADVAGAEEDPFRPHPQKVPASDAGLRRSARWRYDTLRAGCRGWARPIGDAAMSHRA